MKYISAATALALAAAVQAAPAALNARQASSSATSTVSAGVSSASGAATSTAGAASSASTASGSASTGATANNDTEILQYALTLEHLEAAFYNQSIAKFSEQDFQAAGLNASVRNQLYSVGQDEAAHAAFLTQAIGQSAVQPCTYNFSSVTDVPSFLATATVLEGVGVSAYLGAAPSISNKTYLAAAGSILTVEARHNSIVLAAAAAATNSTSNNAAPSPFDTPVTSQRTVYSLAAPFFESCPQDLGLQAFPALNVTPAQEDGTAESAQPSGVLSPGARVQLDYEQTGGNTQANTTAASNGTSTGNMTYLAIVQGPLPPTFVPIEGGQATLPANGTYGGQAYAVITTDNSTVSDDNTLAVSVIMFAAPLPIAPPANSSDSATTSSSASDSASSTTATASLLPTDAATAAATASASAVSVGSQLSGTPSPRPVSVSASA